MVCGFLKKQKQNTTVKEIQNLGIIVEVKSHLKNDEKCEHY